MSPGQGLKARRDVDGLAEVVEAVIQGDDQAG